eukprot:2406825-Rhodomonas_salina.2
MVTRGDGKLGAAGAAAGRGRGASGGEGERECNDAEAAGGSAGERVASREDAASSARGGVGSTGIGRGRTGGRWTQGRRVAAAGERARAR